MSSENQPIDYTPRGFAVWAQFEDLYDQPVSVVTSSLATEPALWIQPHNEEDIHLSGEQAVLLRDALNAWLSHGGDL